MENVTQQGMVCHHTGLQWTADYTLAHKEPSLTSVSCDDVPASPVSLCLCKGDCQLVR